MAHHQALPFIHQPQSPNSSLHLEPLTPTSACPNNTSQISTAKTHFTTLLFHVQAIAHDYRQLGSYFHNLSGRDRYHRYASVPRITQEAVVDFVISSGRKMPEMITILGTCEMLLSRTAALLDIDGQEEEGEEDVEGKMEIGEVYEAYWLLMQVVQEMGYAWRIMGKLAATIRLYEAIVSERLQRGDSGEESNRYRDRQFRQARRWFDSLPEVCFGELPMADRSEVRAQAAARVRAIGQSP